MTSSRTARRFTVRRSTATRVHETNRNAWYVIDSRSGRAVETLDDRAGARLARDYFEAVHGDTDPDEL